MSWLKSKISIHDAEAKNMVVINGRNIPFGFISSSWRHLLSNMVDGDELYEFSSPDVDWDHLAGREGIALVRGGEIITDIVTKMN